MKNQNLYLNRFYLKLLHHLPLSEDLIPYIKDFIVLSHHHYIELQKWKHKFWLWDHFNNHTLVFLHSKRIHRGNKEEYVIQKLMPTIMFHNWIMFRTFVSEYIDKMKYIEMYADLGLWINFNHLFQIVQEIRFVNVECITIIGFSFEVLYFSALLNKFKTMTWSLLSQ